jgi:hypothetical protein
MATATTPRKQSGDQHPRLIRNSKSLTCTRCGGIHEFVTRLSDDCPCDVPVAFSLDVAKNYARLHAGGDRDVVRVPHRLTQLVVLDDSARRLPRTGTGPMRLAQFEIVSRSI